MGNKSKLFIAVALVALLLSSVPMAVMASDADSSSSNDTYSSNIGYDSLKDEKDKNAYIRLGLGMGIVEQTGQLPNILMYDDGSGVEMKQVQKVFEVYQSDNPGDFWAGFYDGYAVDEMSEGKYVGIGVSEKMQERLDMNLQKLNTMKVEFNKKMAEINKSDPNASLYDRLKYLQTKVNTITSYTDDIDQYPNCGSAYGALCQGKAKCDGYSLAFALLCHRENIPCVVIDGYAKTEITTSGHAWNAVKMDDGKWYYVDTTWDDNDDKITYDYFLVGSQTVIRGDDVIEKSRTVDYDYGITVSKDKYVYTPSPTPTPTPSSNNSDNTVWIIVAVVVIVIIILAILAWYYFKKKNDGAPPQQ